MLYTPAVLTRTFVCLRDDALSCSASWRLPVMCRADTAQRLSVTGRRAQRKLANSSQFSSSRRASEKCCRRKDNCRPWTDKGSDGIGHRSPSVSHHHSCSTVVVPAETYRAVCIWGKVLIGDCNCRPHELLADSVSLHVSHTWGPSPSAMTLHTVSSIYGMYTSSKIVQVLVSTEAASNATLFSGRLSLYNSCLFY